MAIGDFKQTGISLPSGPWTPAVQPRIGHFA
jgi:hypothetical protein